MMTEQITEPSKQNLRTQYKKIRAALTPQEVQQNSDAIFRSLTALPAWQNARTVMCYLSFRQEVDTTAIYEQGLREGKTMLIPICAPSGGIMEMSRLDSMDRLVPNRYGIPELPEALQQMVSPDAIDLCIIPGIAFDRAGHRIGFGAGYYDRYLPKVNACVPRIALAHSCQMHPAELPVDAHDLPMDMILTEQGIIRCR